MPYLIFPSDRRRKKYFAAFYDHKGNYTGEKVYFGDTGYQHYEDKTPLQMYSHLDHKDETRKKRYYQRHKTAEKMFSSKWFSHKYLW